MSDDEIETPETIGPFKVVRAIARGGMASVFEVLDPKTDERFALKLLMQKGLARPRFDREYRALTRLDHPNIVRVYRFGFDEERRPYLTMELLDGVAAQVHAKACGRPGTPRRTAEVARMVAAVAEALDYLHQREIIHRDLKSSNVVVMGDGRIKLLDFGTARLGGGQSEEITRNGEFVGTFAYASPEQLQGKPVDHRADIYSLGVLFYRLLTGKRPFEADSPHALALLHLEQDPQPPLELAPGLPIELNDLCLQMLAKSPELRPSSAREVALRLRDFGREEEGGGSQEPLPPTLIGREDELGLLRATVDKARPGRMLLLVGPSGSGRRRLLDQAALDAHRKGRRVFRGEMPGTSALGPLHDIVERCVRGLEELPEGGDELQVLAELPRGGLPSAAEQARVFQAVSSALLRRQAFDRRPMVLVLSDLHRAPPLAVQALRALRAHAEERGAPIIVLASASPEADRPGALMRRQFADAARLELVPLSPRGVGRLVGSMLGRKPPPPELTRRIHEATGGLPGYVEEVVRAMVASGMVEGRSQGPLVEWVDRSEGRVAIPASVREALSLRLQMLAGPARRLLGALAVAGGSAEASLLAHAAELDLELCQAHLQALEKDGILLVLPGGAFAFRLGLTAEIVLGELRSSRRLVFERRLAAKVADAPASPARVRILRTAGRLAEAVQEAVALVPPESSGAASAELRLEMERLAAALGAQERALPAALHFRFLLCLAGALAAEEPEDARVDRALERAQAIATGWARKAEVFVLRARVARLRGQAEGERALLAKARAQLARVADPGLRQRIWLASGHRMLADGEAQAALDAFREAQGAAEQAGEARIALQARSGIGQTRLMMGELLVAERTLRGVVEAAERVEDLRGALRARVPLAEVLRLQARYSESMGVLLSPLDRVREQAPPDAHARVLLGLMETLLELRRLGEARELHAELLAIEAAGHTAALRARRGLIAGRLLIEGDEGLAALDLLAPLEEQLARQDLPVEHGLVTAWIAVAAAIAQDRHRAQDSAELAVQRLKRERNLPALAQACLCQARVSARPAEAEAALRPVLRWAEAQQVRSIRMVHALLRLERALEDGELREALPALERAERLFDEIGQRLDPIDNAALRLHPWQRALGRARAELRGNARAS